MKAPRTPSNPGTETRPDEIAIVGIGCWYPGARTPKQLWENILGRRRQFRRMPDVRLPLSEYQDDDKGTPDKTYGVRAAVIDGYEFDWAGKRIPRTSFESTDIVHWLSLDVALQMLEDAGYQPGDLPRETTQVVIGNTLTGEFTRSNTLRLRWPFVNKVLSASAAGLGMPAETVGALSKSMEQSFKSVFAPINEDTLAGALANTIAGRVCNYLNLNGGGYTVDGACSSSLLAVYSAATALADGVADFAIAGGVDVSLDPFELIGFAKTGALTPTEMAVYDKRGNGFIPGEGCGFVGMKRLADAQRDGDKIYAVLDGWGMSSDGKGGITAPSVNGQSLALSRAYRQAGIDTNDIHFIEGHGTGTSVGDKTELLGITKALQRDGNAGRRTCGVTSFKSIVGHTKAAAGIGAFIKAVIAVNQRVVPPTAGCERPHDLFSKESTCLYPVIRGEIHPQDKELRAGVSAMGFGGINLHVTLKSGGKPVAALRPDVGEQAAMASRQDSEVFCFAAESLQELKQLALTVRAEAVGASLAEMADMAAALNSQVDPKLTVRSAVVAQTPEELTRKLAVLIDRLAWPPQPGRATIDQHNLIVVGNHVEGCALGYVFPGQGSQRINMARGLVERFDWARTLVANADDWAAEMGTDNLSGSIYPDSDRYVTKEELEPIRMKLEHTTVSQPAIVLSSVLWLSYLNRLGLAADVVMGHSLGELTAFHAAGAFDAHTLIQLAALRGQLMAGNGIDPVGTMVSLACDRARAETLIEKVRGQGVLVVANINSPSQTVVSGEIPAIAALHELATQHGVAAHRLSVSNAFHSPLVASAADLLREQARIPRSPSRLNKVLISSCDGRSISPDVDLREHFSSQILRPVDFVGAVASFQKFCHIAFEVGPSGVLSNLIAGSSKDDDFGTYPIERQAESFHDLNWLVALTHAHGKTIRWEELYANRVIRPFVTASKLAFIVNPCERQLESAAATPARLLGSAVGITESDMERVGLKVDGVDLEDYFARRAGFIRDVIRADVRSSASGVVTASAPSGTMERPVVEQPAVVMAGPPGLPERNVTSDQQEAGSPEHEIQSIVAAFTGFDASTLSMSLNLLDDLNLDSIKAGELVAQIARRFNLQDKIDPADFATAKLADLLPFIERGRDRTVADAHTATPQPAAATGATDDGWVRSFEMRLVPSTLVADQQTYPDYRSSVVAVQHDDGDEELAAAISARLRVLGATVFLSAPAELEQEVREDINHVIVLLPRTSALDGSGHDRLPEAIKRLRAPAVVSAQQATCLSLSFVQFGGISQGLELAPGGIDTGSASAFAASIHLERPGLNVRVLDFDVSHDRGFVADRIVAEQGGSERYVLSHYSRDTQRHVLEPKAIEPQLQLPRSVEFSRPDVVLVTGGAKGITAECAFAFAQTTGARMMLVGSSAYIDEEDRTSSEIGRTLARYAEAGLFARYLQCDIVDADAVSRLVEGIQREYGPITAVVHGAGMNKPRRVEQVAEQQALDEVSPKLRGIVNICSALDAVPPKLIAAFSSIIGVTGMAGNAWYAFSNEALNLCLQGFRAAHPNTQTVALAYSVWGDVGMGAKMGSAKQLAKKGISAIPSAAGTAHFLNAVLRQSPANQVVIASRLGELDTWRSGPPAGPVAHRFIQDIQFFQPGVELVSRVRLTLHDDRYLGDHYYRGVYLFPTVFGLEAMAQCVAKVTGLQGFTSLKVVDISLPRPIVVDREHGALIQIRAEVVERQNASEPLSVKVGIGTEQTGFTRDHFAATFVLEPQHADIDAQSPALPDRCVDIDPQTELYGGLLFQGPLFQRLHKVWQMSSFGSLLEITRRTETGYFSPAHSPALILGDPSFRDVLLQSAQLSVKTVSLPVHIDALYLYSLGHTEVGIGIAQNHIISRIGPVCDVTALTPDHRPIERLEGYRLKEMESNEDAPEPEDWANPGRRDDAVLSRALAEACDKLKIIFPTYQLAFDPELAGLDRDRRRLRERPLLIQVVSEALAANHQSSANAPEIAWRDDGKPVVRGVADGEVSVSLSHDGSHCLCVAGEKTQGCDIERIVSRSQEEWTGLLGNKRPALLRELMEAGDSLDDAGTRIWCASESARKALGAGEITLQAFRREQGAVLFSVTLDTRRIYVVTFAVALTRPPRKMVALTVQSALQEVRPPAPGSYPVPSAVTRVEHGLPHFRPGPLGRPSPCCHFRVSFKDTTTARQGLNFPVLADWMGKLRELGTVAIAERLVPDLASGNWGMVTNHSDIQVTGEAACLDLIEGRMHISRAYGKFNSSVAMHFEWLKIAEDGSEHKIASSHMTTTWVEILGHGVVEARPFPQYMQDFFDEYLPSRQPGDEPSGQESKLAQQDIPTAGVDARLGACLYRSPKGPNREPELINLTFNTASADSNLVGNIYYSTYYHLMSRLMDRFFYDLGPELFTADASIGEFRCLRSAVRHLREAMPFDRIEVVMALPALYRKGIQLRFDFYKLGADGLRTKLAVGDYEAVWVAAEGESPEIPDLYQSVLIGAGRRWTATELGHRAACQPGGART